MKKKPTTITLEDLAAMMARGFESMITKQDTMEIEIKGITKRLDDIDYRLSRIETNHERRLDILEDKIRIFETIFVKNLKIKLPK